MCPETASPVFKSQWKEGLFKTVFEHPSLGDFIQLTFEHVHMLVQFVKTLTEKFHSIF